MSQSRISLGGVPAFSGTCSFVHPPLSSSEAQQQVLEITDGNNVRKILYAPGQKPDALSNSEKGWLKLEYVKAMKSYQTMGIKDSVENGVDLQTYLHPMSIAGAYIYHYIDNNLPL